MAIQVERMIAVLEARLDKYERGLAKASSLTNRQFTAIERRGKQLEQRLRSVGAGIGRWLAGGLAAGLSINGMQRLSDAATRIDNALKVAGLSGSELEKVYSRLRDSAVKNAAPIEALVELYSRASLVQKELGVSSEELGRFTDNVALALRVSGKSASESSGALLQLSQALGSGVVRAEEFSSILEGAPTILQAAAAGISEAGGSVSALRQIMLDGELSSRALFDGIAAGASTLEQKVAGSTFTMDQSISNLGTALIDVAREFNNSTGASQRLAGGINDLAGAISDLDVSGFISKIEAAHGAVDEFLKGIANSSFMERFAEFLTGTELTVGKPVAIETKDAENKLAGLDRQIKFFTERLEANRELSLDTTEAEANLNALIAKADVLRAGIASGVIDPEAARSSINSQVPFNPLPPLSIAPPKVSVKDPKYRVADIGNGRSIRARENDYQREIEQIKGRTAAIQAETAAMAGINPLVNDYGFALEKAMAAQDMLTAAKRAGIAVTPELRAQIDELAGAYALASVESAKLAEEQDRLVEAMEDMQQVGKDVLGGFIQDMLNGQSAAEALKGALAKVADKLIEIGLSSVFEGLFPTAASSGGNFLQALFGGFRAGGGPVQSGKAYVVGEKRPELFVPNQSGSILPAVPQMPKMSASSNQSVSLAFAPSITIQGGGDNAGEQVTAALKKFEREFTPKVLRSLREAKTAGML